MTKAAPFFVPIINRDDIQWVETVLSLPDNGFGGPTTARSEVLLSNQSTDMSACPGSGKTTLAVAKIGVLSRHWTEMTRGMCVLSHTNAARHEIETRLSKNSAGRRLLAYPHYVGTIHGFVNEFLALPFLRSLRFPVKIIDTDICSRKRWFRLDYGTRKYLEQRRFEPASIRLTDSQFNFGKEGGVVPFKPTTETYKKVRAACENVARDGYHCYDDMFMWANELLASRPDIVQVLRDRFPVVIIDEAQDNSESQSSILQALFPPGIVIRYRFGDTNQAIFDFMGGSGATTDVFPNPDLLRSIPDSYRFGQIIADIADPLGINPYGLRGLGPRSPLSSGLSSGPHTIFLFEQSTIDKVLAKYAEVLLDTFSDDELTKGTFTAVGQVHNPPLTYDSNQFPKYVGDYWRDYDPELANREARASLFVGYITDAQRQTRYTMASFAGINKFAEAVMRVVQLADSGKRISARKNQHRFVLEQLEPDSELITKYWHLLLTYVVDQVGLTQDSWENEVRPVILDLARKLIGAPVSGKAANDFLQWASTRLPDTDSRVSKKPSDNVYHYSANHREVRIRVGSIHSVKGETHNATLILETFWHEHNIASILPWLAGERSGGGNEGKRQSLRLRVHYVAMTRPTHLVCLALNRSFLSNASGEVDAEIVGKLRAKGWRVVVV